MRILSLLPLMMLPACAAGQAAPPARMEVASDRLFLPVSLSGETVPGLLDSAAEMSFVDDDTAARLKLKLAGAETAKGTGGTAEVRFAEGVRIEAAGVSLPSTTLAVLDLQDLVERLFKRPVEAVVGREFFDSGRLRIDIERGLVSAVPREAEPKGVRYSLTTHRGVESFPAAIEGQAPVQADFDLGNGSEVLVGRAYAERIGLTAPGRIVAREKGGGIGGGVERDIVILKTLTLGGRTFRDVRAAIDPTENAADLNVGVRILRHFVITTDFPQHALWLEPR